MTERDEKHVVHRDAYRRLDADELREASDDLDRAPGARGFAPGAATCVQDVYARKFTAAFTAELNRSVAWWIARWVGEPGT